MVLKAPKVTQRPTLPFEDADVERILKAADQLSDWGTFGPKARAMVLLLRYSGLRMQDAACLERARLKDGKLFLYTQKTGTPVNCPLPPVAVSALNERLERASRLLLLGRPQRTRNDRQELESRFQEDVPFGDAADRGRTSPPVPRHVRRLAAA